MESALRLYDQFLLYMDSGGFVMWPLFILVMVLWFSLGYRYHAIQRGTRKSVRNLVRKVRSGSYISRDGIIDDAVLTAVAIRDQGYSPAFSRELIHDAFFTHRQLLKKYRRTIATIVMVAPLIGLLGTVIGMIETFDSLASMTLFSQSGGIAGGISQALFTTQLGLVVAVPGLVIGRLIDRRAVVMEMELEQIKDILCSEGSK